MPQDAFGHAVAAFAYQAPNVGRGGKRPEPCEADHFLFGAEIDQRRRDACERHDVGLQDCKRHGCGHARVDCVAARVEHAHGGSAGERMSARHRMMAAYDGWPPRT